MDVRWSREEDGAWRFRAEFGPGSVAVVVALVVLLVLLT